MPRRRTKRQGRRSALDLLKQIPSQLELAFGSSGEAARAERSAETAPAKRGSERLGASGLMEAVCERRNLQAALKRVRQNRGSPGIDGMTVEELPDHLRAHWLHIREEFLAGRYQPQPVKRVAISKPGGGERVLGIPTPIVHCTAVQRAVGMGRDYASLPSTARATLCCA